MKNLNLVSMIRRVAIYIFLIFIILTSCNDQSNLTEKSLQVSPNILHPLLFDEESRGLLNFPLWFNDSIISVEGIKEIKWTEYEPVIDIKKDSTPIERKTQFIFRFNDAGFMTRYEQTDYDNGIRVSRQLYFISNPDKMGYSRVKAAKKTGFSLSRQALYSPVRHTERVASYQHKTTMHQLHFLLNDYFHSPLSVDSIAHPTPNDWIILGTPGKPLKRYQVRNTVKERNITLYTYYNDNYPKRIVSEHYPFTHKRYFDYTSKGIFKGCIDTIFIDHTPVTIERFRVIYDSLKKPVRIDFSKGHPDGSIQSKRNTSISYKTRYSL